MPGNHGRMVHLEADFAPPMGVVQSGPIRHCESSFQISSAKTSGLSSPRTAGHRRRPGRRAFAQIVGSMCAMPAEWGVRVGGPMPRSPTGGFGLGRRSRSRIIGTTTGRATWNFVPSVGADPLRPLGYEVRVRTGDEVIDNRLVVELCASSAGGKRSARASCLSTGEAQSIGTWLRQVAAGEVPTVALDVDKEVEPNLTFLEPDLAFSLAPSNDGLWHLRVHLSHRLAAPWLPEEERFSMWHPFVNIPASEQGLLDAASAWEAELAPFPWR